MPTITTKDGVEIFYKDWGSARSRSTRICWRSFSRAAMPATVDFGFP